MSARFPALLPPAARHLANRFTYGVNSSLAAEITSHSGASSWFGSQLSRSAPESNETQSIPAWFPLLKNPPAVTVALAVTGSRSTFAVGNDLIAQTFARRILSRHQVYESMVDVWSNLLYIPASEDRSYPWRHDFDERAIRPYALGTYRQLLRAAIVHPAMAGFLTNDLNHKDGINENLGRELLELHTVGRESDYSERDVLNSSRMLTGYTVAVYSNFDASYDPNRHHVGKIKVLNFTHRNANPDGRAALGAMLDHLAMHPATARRIARRLCVRFVSDSPPDSIVTAVARTYRSSGSDIKACLRTLTGHRAFRDAAHRKSWTPSDDVVHAARVLNLTPNGALTPDALIFRLIQQATNMGQVSYRWPRPDGWPETSDDYLSASRVLRSWRSHLDLSATASGLLQNVTVPAKSSELPHRWPLTLTELVDHQSQRLVGRPGTSDVVRAVSMATGLKPGHKLKSASEVSDARYQLMRGTILNSPAGLQR